MVDTMMYYNITIFPFLCELVLCSCLLHTPDLTSHKLSGYTLDYTAGAWPHEGKFTLLGTYSHTWVLPSVRVALSVTFILGLLYLWTYDLILTDGKRLIPSLHIVPCQH